MSTKEMAATTATHLGDDDDAQRVEMAAMRKQALDLSTSLRELDAASAGLRLLSRLRLHGPRPPSELPARAGSAPAVLCTPPGLEHPQASARGAP